MPIQEGGRWSPQERIVSPGVFTRENDLSFLPQGISNIGGAIIAPFKKGPAYSPTLVDNVADLETLFGIADGDYYGPYSAKEYLKNQGTLTVIRVGALGGYIQKNPLVLYAKPSVTARLIASESLVDGARLKDCTATVVTTSSGSSNGEYSFTASLYGTWNSGPNSGSVATIGTIQFSVDESTAATFVTSSDTDVWFTTASIDDDISFTSFNYEYSGSIPVLAGGAEIRRVSIPTSNKGLFYIDNATISGSYGSLDFDNAVVSDSGSLLLAVLANTAYDTGQNWEGFSGSALASSSNEVTDKYDLTLYSGGTQVGTYKFSIDPTNSSYLANVFGTDPKAGQVAVATGVKPEVAYVYKQFKDTIAKVWGEMSTSGSWKLFLDSTDSTVYDPDADDFVASYAMKFSDGVPGGGGGADNTAWSDYDISTAYTPFVTSQLIAPWSGVGSSSVSQSFELFKFHTLSHGTEMNTAYKVEISNVKTGEVVAGTDYPEFDVAIRAYRDTDARPQILESFPQCNLNPNSVNYIARKIGDSYRRINFNGKVVEFGDFGNKSRYVRVEMTESPYPVSAMPYGFKAYATPIGGEEHVDKVPAIQYGSASIYSQNLGRYPSGVVFNPAPVGADAELSSLYPDGSNEGADLDNKQYNAPIPTSAGSGNNVDFDLETYCNVSPIYSAITESDNIRKRKFIFGFQGGFDGTSPAVPLKLGDNITATNQQGLDCSTSTASGSVGYSLAVAALGNADEVDINLVWTPGIIYNYHTPVVRDVIDMCEARGDCFYVFDTYQNQTAGGRSVQNVVDKAAEFDTNYAATYYPWMRIIDTNTNRLIKVPPSVVMPSVYAQSDRSAAEWFAPAGLNRGGIEIAKSVVDKLTHSERDVLYEGRVNPIVSFPGQGVSVWGQKTLQVQPSALDRINVRRLLIAVKKYIASTSKFLVFEQNVSSTRNRFLSIVNPYLESVQQRNGLYAFRVVMDESNNTPDVIDRNILYGQIYLQPTKTSEYILLDFNVLPSGAAFDGI